MLTRRRKNKNSGFTLLELLLVMAILVVLASLSTFAILNLREGALQKSAFLQIETLKEACRMYKTSVGSFPSSLNDLYTMPSGLNQGQWGGPYLEPPVAVDPWQQPYTYSADEANQRVTITSNGPDRQAGTQDDVPAAMSK